MGGFRAAWQAMVGAFLRCYMVLAFAALVVAWGLRLQGYGPVSPVTFPIYFYQKAIGSLDGRSCPSYPICSAYAAQALQKHGILIGGWAILDRLIHEGGDLEAGPWVSVNGELRLYDPLERNDFWLEDG